MLMAYKASGRRLSQSEIGLLGFAVANYTLYHIMPLYLSHCPWKRVGRSVLLTRTVSDVEWVARKLYSLSPYLLVVVFLFYSLFWVKHKRGRLLVSDQFKMSTDQIMFRFRKASTMVYASFTITECRRSDREVSSQKRLQDDRIVSVRQLWHRRRHPSRQWEG